MGFRRRTNPYSYSLRQTSTRAAIVLPLKKKKGKKIMLPIEIHMTLVGLQAMHKSTLLLPQCSHHRQTSTGAAMVIENPNSNKGTAAHRDACDFLWASGDAQNPHSLLHPSSQHRQTSSTGAAKVFKINQHFFPHNRGMLRRSRCGLIFLETKGTTAAHRDNCDTLWASGDARTHNLVPAWLPHCSIAAR